jgi:hypothetical protein
VQFDENGLMNTVGGYSDICCLEGGRYYPQDRTGF